MTQLYPQNLPIKRLLLATASRPAVAMLLHDVGFNLMSCAIASAISAI
jgi:hypothetical protein